MLDEPTAALDVESRRDFWKVMRGVAGSGKTVVLTCADSDLALRDLLARFPQARDIEVKVAGLEEAFVELTGADNRPKEEVK